MLSLEQVADFVYDVLRLPDVESHSNYPRRYVDKLVIIRETYIEHLAIPELSVTSIAKRRITGLVTVEESAFWDRVISARK